MLKYLIYIRLTVVFIFLFLIGCSEIVHNARPKPQKKLFNDEEISAFMEDEELINDNETSSLTRKQQNTPSKRPIWAKVQFLNLETNNYIARVGFSKIGNRRRQEVSDSLRDKIREKLARDVKTHIEQETMDSVSIKIVEQGKQKAAIREHISTVISRHYSNIIFNGVYDESSQWVDQQGDTLWYFIKYNKTKYILEEQRRIVEEIRKAGSLAYKYLDTSHKALSYDSDMAKALTALGLASYQISKGGGSATENDLFRPGSKQNLILQRHELLKEIDKSIGISLINNKDEKYLTRNKPFIARIRAHRNTKGYELNRVKLRIQSDSDMLNFPETVPLEEDGSVEIQFYPTQDIYGQTVSVTITFDIISEMIPDKQWYKTDDYTDLLKELPKINFKIKAKEFAPLRTWAFIHSNVPDGISQNVEHLQGTLEKELGRIPEFFNVVPRRNWPVSYKTVQAYKSEEIPFRKLGFADKQEIQNHDLDLMLEVNDNGKGKYLLTLSGTSPTPASGGLLSTNLDGILKNDINNKLKTLVDTFVNEYFYRKIHLSTPVTRDVVNLDFRLNDNKLRPLQLSPQKLEFSGLSRFTSQELVVKSPGYREQKFVIDGEVFNLSISPNSTFIIKMEYLVPVQGTLNITVLDSLTGKPVLYGRKGQGLPPVIKVRKWYGFFPNPFESVSSNVSYKASFPIDQLGKYYVSVSKQHYGSPFPKIVTVYDDEDFEHKHLNNIRFSLLKQPLGPAIVKSTIVPGWGQWSLGKKKESISYFVGTVITALWGGYQYISFKREVDNYELLKSNYKKSNTSKDWLELEGKLEKSENKLNNYKNQLYGSLAATGLIWSANLITVTW